MKPSRRSFLSRVALVPALVGLVASLVATARADPMTVSILPSGDETFIEDGLRSGQIEWQAQENLTLSVGRFRFQVVFQFSHSDPDNVPVNPTVSQLLLLNWPVEFGTTIPWTFGQYSDRVGSPINTWIWSAETLLSSTVMFPAGTSIGSAAWSTGGEDVDDMSDDGSFGIRAEATHLVDTGDRTLILKVARDTKGLNPEPVPEPTSLSVVLLGALGLLRRRLRAGTDLGR